MPYTFRNRNGVERSYDNLQDYVRALTNQRRVEHLQDVNAGYVTEEMRHEWYLEPEKELDFTTDRQR